MPFFSGRCYSQARLDKKTTVITGCNTGIGKETALDFYKRGAHVIMACRDLTKAEKAKTDIETKCKSLDQSTLGTLKVVKLDLGSLKSIRECAQLILETEPEVNILVNNAGVMMCPLLRTEDGFEMQIGTNHLGHFLFTLLLLPRIRQSVPARIVNVSSLAHTLHAMDFHDINYENKRYMSTVAYSRSKVANILFTRELTARLKEHKIEGINTYSLHPGVIETELARHLDKGLIFGAQWVWSKFKWFKKTPELGAQTTIYCSVDEKCANETGLYYSDCVPINPAKHAKRDKDAKTLWEMSMELVKLENYDPFTAEDPGIKL